jgi:hypothetical protein
MDRHIVIEKLDSNIISLSFVKSQEQVADILTKTVRSKEFDDALKILGQKISMCLSERECNNKHSDTDLEKDNCTLQRISSYHCKFTKYMENITCLIEGTLMKKQDLYFCISLFFS